MHKDLSKMETTSQLTKGTSPHVLCAVASISQSVMVDKVCTMSSGSQQPFRKPLFVNLMFDQHTSEKGLCNGGCMILNLNVPFLRCFPTH